MLIFHEVTSLYDKWLPEVQTLYEHSFPISERRLWKDFLHILSGGECKLLVFSMGERFAGLFIYWELPGFVYLEHMAVVPALRGQNIGEQVLQRFKERLSRLVLETELPEQSDSIRRVKFYQRNGFVSTGYSYEQPPYRSGEQPIPMLLLSNFDIADQQAFDAITSIIRQHVYEPGWHPNREQES